MTKKNNIVNDFIEKNPDPEIELKVANEAIEILVAENDKMREQLKIRFDDPTLTMLCAFRYALGRRTYVTSCTVGDITKNWDELNKYHQSLIQREIDDYKELHGNLGDSCDEQQWNEILKLTIKED